MDENQEGFRMQKSTGISFGRLSANKQIALRGKRNPVVIFLDNSNAFDSVWQKGVFGERKKKVSDEKPGKSC